MKKLLLLAVSVLCFGLVSCSSVPLAGLKADGSGVSYSGQAKGYNYTITVTPQSGKNPVPASTAQ